MSTKTPETPYLTVAEAARLAGVSRAFAFQQARRGRVRVVHIGGRQHLHRDEALVLRDLRTPGLGRPMGS